MGLDRDSNLGGIAIVRCSVGMHFGRISSSGLRKPVPERCHRPMRSEPQGCRSEDYARGELQCLSMSVCIGQACASACRDHRQALSYFRCLCMKEPEYLYAVRISIHFMCRHNTCRGTGMYIIVQQRREVRLCTFLDALFWFRHVEGSSEHRHLSSSI